MKSRSPNLRVSRVAGIVFAAPYLVLLILFGIVPVILAIEASLAPSRSNPAGGLGTYLAVLQDFRFLPAVANVVTFLAIYVPLMMIAVTATALLLDSYQTRLNLPLRLAYIVPASISGSVAILVWYFMLEPTLSPYRDLLNAIGITRSDQIWNSGNLVWIFAAMAFATGAGNWIIIQYGSLQSIPQELIEASRLDGCSVVQTALLIKLPLVRKYLVYMGILTFAAGIQVFVEPQLISSSVYRGIANNWSLNQLGYTFAFGSSNFASSAALSLILLIVCLASALVLIFKTDFFERERLPK